MLEATINDIKLSTYGLMLTDVSISEPVPNRQTVTVPHRNGKLDLSFGPMTYQNRSVVLTCTVKTTPMSWEKTKEQVYEAWHGQNVEAIIDDEPDYAWTGFCEITAAERDQNKGTIKISIDAYPYRMAAAIKKQAVMATAKGNGFTFKNEGAINVVPTFSSLTSGTITVSDETNSYSFEGGTGEHQSANIILKAGKTTTLIFKATTNIDATVTWREGRF